MINHKYIKITMENDDQAKIVVLGDTGVGKSSILNQFLQSSFKAYLDSTIGGSFKSVEKEINQKKVRLNIWDTAGQERYQSLTKMYCRGVGAAILVYDITKRNSFENLVKWHSMVLEIGGKKVVFALAGNKEDLVQNEEVSWDEAREFANRIGASFNKTSAMQNSGINEMFEEITYRLFPDNKSSKATTFKLETLSISDNHKKKRCCNS
jgi:small GTP-binding protein